MPSRWFSIGIVTLWIITTLWLVQRDLLPALGVGEMTYERALATRAVDEPVEWRILRGEEEIGHLFFAVRPQPDGRFELQSRASLRVSVPPLEETEFVVSSMIYVDPLKRLDRFGVILSMPQSRSEVKVDGERKDQSLALAIRLIVDDKEQFARETSLAVDPKMMILDLFGQLDRLPDLRQGKTWRTQFVNPMSALLTGTLAPATSVDAIEHRVVLTEEISWNGRLWSCYKVEHRYQKASTHSWARVADGKVLVQEVLFGGTPFRLVAEPNHQDTYATEATSNAQP